MEALIIIFVEAIAGLVSAVIAPALAVMGSLITLLVDLLGMIFSGIWASRSPNQHEQIPKASPSRVVPSNPPYSGEGRTASPTIAIQPSPTNSSPTRRGKRGRFWFVLTAVIAVVALGSVWVLDTFYADDLVRSALERMRARSGLAITAEQIDVDLFDASVHLTGVSIMRDQPNQKLSLTARNLDIDLRLIPLLTGRLAIEEATSDRIRGDIWLRLGEPASRRTGQDFKVDRLLIKDLEINVTVESDNRVFAGPVAIEKWEAVPLRSRWLLFDALFRSQASGSIAGSAFSISSGPADAGRATKWQATHLPVEFLAVHVGGPFKLLRDGHADIVVDDRWSLDEPKYIDMDYRMNLHSVTPVEKIEGPLSAMLTPLKAYLAVKGGELDLAFALRIDPDRFDGATSLDATGLWSELSQPVLMSLAEKLGMKPDEIRAIGGKALDASKTIINRWRQRKDP
jgi:hypothetical protein